MMCLVYTLSIADRYVVSTVLDPIRIELHLTDFGVAALTGTAFGLFYVVLGFPLSWLIDRRSRRVIVGACLVLWSVMTAVCGLARTSLQFFLARVGVTVGEAGGTPGANSILSDYFPATRRAMALTVFSLGAPIGAWIGYNVAGAIADHYGWRMVFFALGIPGVLAGIAVWLTVREPKRGCLDSAEDGAAPSVAATLRFMWQQRSAVHTMMGTAVCALWGWGLMFFTPTFLQRTYHMTVGEAAGVTQNMHLWGGGIATVVTGWLMARSTMVDARRIVWLLAGGIGIATVASGVVYYTRDLALAKAMLWIFIPAIYFYIGPGFGLLNNLAQCRMRAMFCAMVLFLANLGNLVIAPSVIGALSDWFAPQHIANADSLRLAMLCLVPTGLWATAHLVLAARDIVQDQERARSYP
ncbi:MAG: MFS transporter, partial [Gammaproteobacteria bacterium]|nr:MFS transporter [Gammaproteobacteria bacterium]